MISFLIVGLLAGDQPPNVRRMSDDNNVYIVYQIGDFNAVHIDTLPSLPSWCFLQNRLFLTVNIDITFEFCSSILMN